MRERIQKYRYLERFLPGPDSRRLIILTGARQTGKTTLAKSKYSELNYINLDASENREVLRSISTVAWAQSVGNAVIDEAQKEPSLFEKVKYAFDDDAVSFCVMLGSSQILLLKKIRESLAGRVSLYEIWPLTMREIFMDINSHDTRPPLVDRLFSNMPFDEIFDQFFTY